MKLSVGYFRWCVLFGLSFLSSPPTAGAVYIYRAWVLRDNTTTGYVLTSSTCSLAQVEHTTVRNGLLSPSFPFDLRISWDDQYKYNCTEPGYFASISRDPNPRRHPPILKSETIWHNKQFRGFLGKKKEATGKSRTKSVTIAFVVHTFPWYYCLVSLPSSCIICSSRA